jgi:hypothetical protein
MIQFTMILVVLAPVVFLIGLVKPNWVMFWSKKPDRLIASTIGVLLFMAAWTGYSEARLKHKAPGQDRHAEQSSEERNSLPMERQRDY